VKDLGVACWELGEALVAAGLRPKEPVRIVVPKHDFRMFELKERYRRLDQMVLPPTPGLVSIIIHTPAGDFILQPEE
jgi:hypothetical protein